MVTKNMNSRFKHRCISIQNTRKSLNTRSILASRRNKVSRNVSWTSRSKKFTSPSGEGSSDTRTRLSPIVTLSTWRRPLGLSLVPTFIIFCVSAIFNISTFTHSLYSARVALKAREQSMNSRLCITKEFFKDNIINAVLIALFENQIFDNSDTRIVVWETPKRNTYPSILLYYRFVLLCESFLRLDRDK